eukprot:COSAG05_NODE_3895_length_1784_cov_1.463501_1_plen_207_part_00
MASDGCQPLLINGRLAGYNKDNQTSKISFPAGVTNYRALRTGGGRSSTLQFGTVPEGDVEFRTRALYGRNNKAHEKTVFNDAGIPVSTSNATGTNYKTASSRARGTTVRSAPMPQASPPAPLEASWALPGAGEALPAVGWQCSAADAAAAVAGGVSLVDAAGDADAESALGAALSGVTDARPFVASSKPARARRNAWSASAAPRTC